MRNMLQTVDSGLETISVFGIRASAVFLALMIILINIEVVGRYIFGFSTLVADEYGSYFFVWMTFLGFGWTYRRGNFLRLNILLDKVSPRISNWLQGLAAIASSGLCGVLAYCVLDTVRISHAFHSVSLAYSKTPLFVPQIILPVALALLALMFLSEGSNRIRLAMASQDGQYGEDR